MGAMSLEGIPTRNDNFNIQYRQVTPALPNIECNFPNNDVLTRSLYATQPWKFLRRFSLS
jgi:hypothetical protein